MVVESPHVQGRTEKPFTGEGDPLSVLNGRVRYGPCRRTTNHRTEVEPDSFSFGSTIVAAFQVGRIYDGGACAVGFATSANNGVSWTEGLLPGITKWTVSAGRGPNDRATDASVAYDARDG